MQIQKSTCFFTLLYSLLVITLGILGYQRVGSMISLVMGVLFGSLTLISTILMYMEKKYGLYLAFLFSLLLGVAIAFRFGKTLSFMPGAMALLSAAVVIMLLIQIYRINQKLRR